MTTATATKDWKENKSTQSMRTRILECTEVLENIHTAVKSGQVDADGGLNGFVAFLKKMDMYDHFYGAYERDLWRRQKDKRHYIHTIWDMVLERFNKRGMEQL